MKAFALFFLFVSSFVFAQKQPSQAQINKMMKEAQQMQKQMDQQLKDLEKTDPEQAKLIRNMMKQGQTANKNSDISSEDFSGTYPTKPPVKDAARLNKIPSTPLSNAQLIELVKTMRANLQQKLNAQQKTNFENAFLLVQNDAKKIEDAAIVNWINKSPQGALLFAMKAVESNAEEPMYLNNLGALLVQCKKEEKAIPILLKVLQSHPQSGMVLNNLGQAYLGLGDLSTAKTYFEKCLLLIPSHPEANHSMGLIYRFSGNTMKSDYYFEKELQVCFRKPVYDALKSNNVKNLGDALQARWKTAPNFFQQLGLNNLKVPRLPRSLEESNSVYLAHKDFQKNMQDELDKLVKKETEILKQKMSEKKSDKNIYSNLVAALLENFQEIKEKELDWISAISDDGVTEYPSRGNPTTKPWQNLAMQYGKEMDELKRLQLNEDSVVTAIYDKEAAKYIDAPDELTNKWKAQLNAIAIKYCQKEIDLANNYLPQFADMQKNGFKEHADVFPSLINQAFFYSSLTPDDPTPLFEAHNVLMSYLQFLQAYSALTVIANTKANNFQGQGTVTVDCDIEQLKSEQWELSAVENYTPNCPFKITVPLVVAKISYDCKKLEAEGGEGLIVGVEHEFKTGNTTLSFGAGVETNVPFVSVGAKQQLYVTFDSNGNYSDAGFKGEIGAEIRGYGPTVVSKAGYEVGINAGASASIEGAGQQTPINF